MVQLLLCMQKALAVCSQKTVSAYGGSVVSLSRYKKTRETVSLLDTVSNSYRAQEQQGQDSKLQASLTCAFMKEISKTGRQRINEHAASVVWRVENKPSPPTPC